MQEREIFYYFCQFLRSLFYMEIKTSQEILFIVSICRDDALAKHAVIHSRFKASL